MYVSDITKVYRSVWPQRSQIVPCFLSDPGIGKTEQTYAFRDWVRENTEYKDCKVVEIIASQIIPSEVSGLTMPDKDTETMSIYDHARLASLKDGDILFFDELLQGSPQVLSACLTLIQERRLMSGHKLPDILIAAAANPTASPKMIPEAIRQRFMFIPIKVDWVEWKRYMSDKHGINVNPREYSYFQDKDIGDNWNTWSPRTATKLLLWYRDCPEKQVVKNAIADSFDMNVAETIADTIQDNGKVPNTDEEILAEIYKRVLKHITFEEVLAMPDHIDSVDDLIKVIKEVCKYPDEVMAFLDSLEVEEYKVVL